MSIQDDVFEVSSYLKTTLDKTNPIRNMYDNIIQQLWQYETQLEDAEKVIAAKNLLLKTKLNEPT